MGQDKRQTATGNGAPAKALAAVETPASVAIASRGIRDDQDAAEYLTSLIGDVMTEKVPVRIANTGINAMGKLLKLVDMRQKYGSPEKTRSIRLVQDEVVTEAPSSDDRRRALLEELAAIDAACGIAR